jgi:hypothetical protein
MWPMGKKWDLFCFCTAQIPDLAIAVILVFLGPGAASADEFAIPKHVTQKRVPTHREYNPGAANPQLKELAVRTRPRTYAQTRAVRRMGNGSAQAVIH